MECGIPKLETMTALLNKKKKCIGNQVPAA